MTRLFAYRQIFVLLWIGNRLLGGIAALSLPSVSRRDVLIGGSLAGLGGLVLPESALAGGTDAPIAVLGASGRTGALCVAACLQRGLHVRALTRSGTWQPSSNEGGAFDKLLTVAACDVKDPVALQKGIQGCRGVIYAASASKKGGNANEIDNVGVVAAAEACLQANVARYVVISSTATTRPNSLGYKFTNLFGGIMDEKRKGEISVQNAFIAAGESSASSFTIVRPGGLEEPKKNEVLGPSSLEISQGDTLAGIISRADVAEVAVELAASSASNLLNTALELYYTDSAQPCEGKFKAFLTNGVSPRLHGNSYEGLFRGIQPNIDYYEP
jgi:hypothetical protein